MDKSISHYRAGYGVQLPPWFPDEAKKACDLNGDGVIKGLKEACATSRFLSELHKSKSENDQLRKGASQFFNYFVLVDVKAQSVIVYGTKVNLVSDRKLSSDELFQIGEGLRSYSVSLVRESFSGERPLRIVVASPQRWPYYTRNIEDFVVVGRELMNAYLESRVGHGLYWKNTIFIDLEGMPERETLLTAVRHEFGHYVIRRQEDQEPVVANAIHSGLACPPDDLPYLMKFFAMQNSLEEHSQHAYHTRMPFLCSSSEAFPLLMELFFEYEESLPNSKLSFDRYLDTVVRQFVDTGFDTYKLFEHHPYKSSAY
ncbi:MAG: hypothetical protein HY540_06940 [Deltaproteobacteria bacterium]|nr:hypothetical protein [Deltaproteobacteria bacterium]